MWLTDTEHLYSQDSALKLVVVCMHCCRTLIPIPRMSKQERRQLFAMKVAQEEEEERQRRQQQEMWRQHEDRCLALGLDPNLTAAFDSQTGYPCFFDPASGTWQAYPPQGWKLFENSY